MYMLANYFLPISFQPFQLSRYAYKTKNLTKLFVLVFNLNYLSRRPKYQVAAVGRRGQEVGMIRGCPAE